MTRGRCDLSVFPRVLFKWVRISLAPLHFPSLPPRVLSFCTVCCCFTVRLHQPHVVSLFQITTHWDEICLVHAASTDQAGPEGTHTSFSGERWKAGRSGARRISGTDCGTVGYMLHVLLGDLCTMDAASDGGHLWPTSSPSTTSPLPCCWI